MTGPYTPYRNKTVSQYIQEVESTLSLLGEVPTGPGIISWPGLSYLAAEAKTLRHGLKIMIGV